MGLLLPDRVSLLAITLILLSHSAAALAAKKAPAKKTAGVASTGARGFSAQAGVSSTKLPSLGDPQMDAALASRCEVLRTPRGQKDAQPWLELGSLLVKAKEYSEAERVFRAGSARVPKNEMLSGAALMLGGDSAAYCRSGIGDLPSTPAAIDDANFESFEAPPADLRGWDQADRAVDWEASELAAGRRGVVHKSKGPLLDPAECAWVIKQVEAQAAISGWTTDRHVQAPTTDIPVSQVPAIREWFDRSLATTLLPMLASRFPHAVKSAAQLRVMDAFVVRYDAREQASLPTHQDENTLSFTIALNDRSEYEGGGTVFERLRPVGAVTGAPFEQTILNADAGGVVAFPGRLRHGGSVVTSGRRYIIPLFIYVDSNRSGREAGYVLRHLGIEPAADDLGLSRYAKQVLESTSRPAEPSENARGAARF